MPCIIIEKNKKFKFIVWKFNISFKNKKKINNYYKYWLLKKIFYINIYKLYYINKKPYLTNNYNISISHSCNVIGIIISKYYLVSIDIETNISNKILHIKKKFIRYDENYYIIPKFEIEYLYII